MTRIARCCCQACSVEIDGEPTLNAICHCNSCKRRTGSAFGWSAYFRNEDIKARQGELKLYVVAASGGRRWFCSTCGTTLFWEGDEQSGFAGGCFAETPLPEPNLSAYDDLRCAWVGLPDSWMKVSPQP